MPEDLPIEGFQPVAIDAPLTCAAMEAVLKAGDPDDQPTMVETPDGLLPSWTDFRASTGGVNRNGDAICQNSWKLASYRKNPQILWMHDRSQPAIGRGEARMVGRYTDDAHLVVRIHWDMKDARAREICRKAHEGYINAGSVYAVGGKGSCYRHKLPTDHPAYAERGTYEGWGRFLKNCELREFSPVTLPGDANALKLAEDDTDSTPPAPPAPTTTNPGQSMNHRALLLAALALSADATDEDIQAAVSDNPTPAATLAAREETIRQALGLDADAPIPDDVDAQLAAATDRTGWMTLAAATAMANEAVAAAADTVDPKAEAIAAVKLAVKEGRMVPAAQGFWLKLAAKDPAECTAGLATLKSQVVPLQPDQAPETLPTKPAPGSSTQLSADEKAVAKQLGWTDAQFLAARSKHGDSLNPTPQEG